MTLITSPVPQVGAPVASEETDTTALLEEIKTVLNGKVGAENLSSAFASVVNPPIVTALPGSPVTGQRIRFRFTTGVIATLRYNADRAGAFKWEADGDSAWTVGPQVGAGNVGGAGAAYLPFGGPGGSPNVGRIIVPLAGVYRLTAGARPSGDTITALAVNSAADDNWQVAAGGVPASRIFPDLSLAAGDNLAFAHRSPSGGACSSTAYFLSLVPLAVG